MTYHFSGNVTLEDYVQLHESIHRKFSRKTHIALFSVFATILIIIGILGSMEEGDKMVVVEFAVYSAILLLFYPLLVFLSRSSNRLIWKNYYKSDAYRGEECFYTIDENEIVIKTESSCTKTTKDIVHAISTDKDSLYIFTSTSQTHVIKARYFKTAEEYDEVRKYLLKNYTST